MIGASRLSEASEQVEQAAAAGDWDAIRAGMSTLDQEGEDLNVYIEQI